jgi:predicted alpha/beta-fold hydrolase
MYISHQYPEAILHGLGFSLGANVMTRYIAEEGNRTRLHSGCALACVSQPRVFLDTSYRDADSYTAVGLGEK